MPEFVETGRVDSDGFINSSPFSARLNAEDYVRRLGERRHSVVVLKDTGDINLTPEFAIDLARLGPITLSSITDGSRVVRWVGYAVGLTNGRIIVFSGRDRADVIADAVALRSEDLRSLGAYDAAQQAAALAFWLDPPQPQDRFIRADRVRAQHVLRRWPTVSQPTLLRRPPRLRAIDVAVAGYRTAPTAEHQRQALAQIRQAITDWQGTQQGSPNQVSKVYKLLRAVTVLLRFADGTGVVADPAADVDRTGVGRFFKADPAADAMLAELRAATQSGAELREGLLGPDVFGLRRPPAPAFPNLNHRSLQTGQLVPLLKRLDLAAEHEDWQLHQDDPTRDDTTRMVRDLPTAGERGWAGDPDSIDEDLRELPARIEIPRLIHSIWFGRPLVASWQTAGPNPGRVPGSGGTVAARRA